MKLDTIASRSRYDCYAHDCARSRYASLLNLKSLLHRTRNPKAAGFREQARLGPRHPAGTVVGPGRDARVEDAPLRGSPADVGTLTDAPQR
jgi:hypothetical protein